MTETQAREIATAVRCIQTEELMRTVEEIHEDATLEDEDVRVGRRLAAVVDAARMDDEKNVMEWKRTTHRGRACWESCTGSTAYVRCPPATPPLTADDVAALPDNTRITVLWGGGNGPHEYTLRDGSAWSGDVFVGRVRMVGNKRWHNKVWLPIVAEEGCIPSKGEKGGCKG